MNKKLLILFFCLITANLSFSCICDRPAPIEKYAEHADEIFIGMVINQECTYSLDSATGKAYANNFITTFDVIEKFKGNQDKTLYLTNGSNSCDDYFEIGRGLYLVFAFYAGPDSTRQINEILNSSQCLPNGLLYRSYDWETKTRPKNKSVFEDIDSLRAIFPNKIELKEITKNALAPTEPETEEVNIYFYISIILTTIICGIIILKLTMAKNHE